MRNLLLGFIAVGLAACGAPDAIDAPPLQPDRPEITPTQFALLPCPKHGERQLQCLLLAAGGKRFLLGAPEGALDVMGEEDIAFLDGVLLFSLTPNQIEGLDRIRNETWIAGRMQPLYVAGPEGLSEYAAALDTAYQFPDALTFERSRPDGGFDAALLAPKELDRGSDGAAVVDTGDLLVRAFEAPSGQYIFHISYGGRTATAALCGAPEDAGRQAELGPVDLAFVCDRETSDIAPSVGSFADGAAVHFVIE